MQLCAGHVKKDGNRPCKLPPIKGATVCRFHGGSAPQVRRKAAERLAEQQAENRARKALAKYQPDAPRDIDITSALLDLAAQVVEWKDFLGEHLSELRDDMRYGHRAGEQVRAEVSLFERALDRAGRLLIDIGKLDLEARRVRISERDAVALHHAVRLAVADIGITGDQLRKLAPALAIRLRELDSGPAQEIESGERQVYVSARRSPVVR